MPDAHTEAGTPEETSVPFCYWIFRLKQLLSGAWEAEHFGGISWVNFTLSSDKRLKLNLEARFLEDAAATLLSDPRGFCHSALMV